MSFIVLEEIIVSIGILLDHSTPLGLFQKRF